MGHPESSDSEIVDIKRETVKEEFNMLGFLVFLGWLVVCGSPFIVYGIRAAKAAERTGEKGPTAGQWWFGVLWAVIPGLLLIVGFIILRRWTEVMWFQELKHAEVFWTPYWAQWKIYLITFCAAFLFMVFNITLTRRVLRHADKEQGEDWVHGVHILLYLLSFVIAVITGWLVKSQWLTILKYLNQVPFGTPDPVFGHDLSFYIFTLPFYEILRNVFISVIVLTMSAVTVSYVSIASAAHGAWEDDKADNRVITHLSVLGIALMGAFIFSAVIARWEVLYSTRGAVFGAGWTDINVQIGAYSFFIAALVVAALALLISAIARSLKVTSRMALVGFGTCALTWLIAIIIVPAWIQHFSVSPNEYNREKPYIERNIASTRQAFGLRDKDLKTSEFPVSMKMTPEVLAQNRNTLDNVRLWDWTALQSTNNQVQNFRLYYNFPDVDVVRYRIGGRIRQLMYSGRELGQDRLAEQAQTWVNRRMVYTHGYGACANPVNTFLMPEGLPDYWLKDIPVKERFPELKMTEPRIYFGEETSEDVFVQTKTPEFDYPKGDHNQTCVYSGSGGVPIGTGLRKLALAFRFDGLRFLTAAELTPQSRVMFRRQIGERVKALLPGIRWDQDPYQVLADGKLWFLWDGYTSSDHYPYSEPLNKDTEEPFNYMRNSVKAVIDAYNGSVVFYVFDPNDPIIGAYQRIFPGLFQSKEAMPAKLRCHVRYPEDMLLTQGLILANYHMSDPNVFYNREDAWATACETSGGTYQTISPYYITMTMPGEKTEEFVLILPFTPLTTQADNPRNNMVGWLCARCDGEHYGELVLYDFPKGQLVYGPAQIGARINQDEVISKDLSLWNQQGSQVFFGNHLVIPLTGYRLLYVQPLFLQAAAGKLPELKRVIVANGPEKIGYATTFAEALEQLVSGGPMRPLTAEAPGATQALSSSELAKEAQTHLENYRKLTADGKFAEAGREMEALSQTISQLIPAPAR